MKYQDFLKELGAEGIDIAKAKQIIRDSQYKKNVKTPMFGDETIEGDLEAIKAYVHSVINQAEADAKAEEEYEQEVANIMITSGYSFEGYKITKYSGYISGDDATFVPLPMIGEPADKLKDKMLDAYARIRSQSLKEIKEAAYGLGCNAVIGLDFDYMITDLPANVGSNYPFVLSVTANGTAVLIEKE